MLAGYRANNARLSNRNSDRICLVLIYETSRLPMHMITESTWEYCYIDNLNVGFLRVCDIQGQAAIAANKRGTIRGGTCDCKDVA